VLVAPTAEPGAATRELPDLVGALLRQQGLERRIALVVPHFLVAPFVVARSDLVMTASRRLIAALPAGLRLSTAQLPAPGPSYRLSQVWARTSTDDSGHRWLRGAVARVARALSRGDP
jgi:DNA-binding transcriptional LysR family regulator